MQFDNLTNARIAHASSTRSRSGWTAARPDSSPVACVLCALHRLLHRGISLAFA